MKLQQLRYAVEVLRRNLNVSEAANALFTSQPGVSKQIRMLEDELGVQIFIRSGKRIVAVTQAGQAILEMAGQVLREVKNIKDVGREFSDTSSGLLTVAATHHMLRFRLPETVSFFTQHYPDVHLVLKQGSPSEIEQWVFNGEADLAIGTDMNAELSHLRRLPCETWCYTALVPREHPLTLKPVVTLPELTSYPLLTYDFALQAGTTLSRAFQRARLSRYRVAFQSADSEVLKSYVRLGLGVALLDKNAVDAQLDSDLVALDVSSLFDTSFYQISLRSDALIRGYAYDFIEHFNPSLNKERVNQLLYTPAVEDFSI